MRGKNKVSIAKQSFEGYMKEPKYTMSISRMTVNKLGVNLYDRISAVIAEIVANSYDGDATEVNVYAPMGIYLAKKTNGKIISRDTEIRVEDDGYGMNPNELQNFYLPVGKERRTDPRRGDRSPIYDRAVMGSKGVGKLAPFGVCKQIEIISSGGEKTKGMNPDGKVIEGYRTAHIVLEKDKILADTDEAYHPKVGEWDETISPESGTTIILSDFYYRGVPNIEMFERQLARRFGIVSPHWRININDILKEKDDPKHSREVGKFSVELLDNSRIEFIYDDTVSPVKKDVLDPDEKALEDFQPGFDFEGTFYPLTGWIGYSKHPYRDDLMAGVRIYCRGKIAAQSHIFNMKAGFTGEYDIRSYLVGEIHANWLDEKEDLIRTDRQDILWSHELGQEFEKWGQAIVKLVGKLTRQPKKKRAWAIFKEVSNIEEILNNMFPTDNQSEIREKAMGFAKIIAQTTKEEDLENKEHVNTIVKLSILFGPNITLDEKLREAAEDSDDPLGVITNILKTARIAELSGFGSIAEKRVKVIEKIETMKDKEGTLESAFQELITEAPWLVDPQWSPVTFNQTFATLKKEFQKYYKNQTGKELYLDGFSDPKKQPDFVMLNYDNSIQIIEIKKPKHNLTNEEMDRIQNYITIMELFLNSEGNQEFKRLFPNGYHVTLVCDGIKLKGVHLQALNSLRTGKIITLMTWESFLLKTKRMHQEFLDEAERQRVIAAR